MTTSLHADEHREGLVDDTRPARTEPDAPAPASYAVQVPIARSSVSALGEE
ncbi:hypothetical protein [Nocardioides sp. Soil774]|uniref:hypothetical protein n=1 Tax=Nocardioides sp. Soil774 TaxID=1736408 RepID=UPI000A6360D0|nr:hypothetical protein [Nocardioides sp. Soil774]